MNIVSHNKPSINTIEVDAVTNVLQSAKLITGKEVLAFERHIKQFVHGKYAIAVVSGHAALHLSFLALNIKKGDEIIVPSYTVPDVLNAIFYVGAIPVVVDIEKTGFNIDPEAIDQVVTKRTKTILVPHMFGFPAKIDKLQSYQIPIIEDCAQALGTIYKGKHVGFLGALNIFSFYAAKLLTTGQGGMIVTNNHEYSKFIKDIIHYNRRKQYKLRYNYPITELAACIGNIQFKKFPYFLARRKEIAKRYATILDTKKITYWPKKDDFESNHFRFLLEFSNKKNCDVVKKALKSYGICTIYPLSSFEVLHRILGIDKSKFPNTEKRINTLLSIPLYPALTEKEIEQVCNALEKVL